jgi:MoxR-like ATPase
MRDHDYATPDDVRDVIHPAFRHRLLLRSEAELDGMTPDLVLDEILSTVEVPR